MTGSNFKYLSRKDERLERMVDDYRALCDKSYDMFCSDPDTFDYESYHKLKIRQWQLAQSIFGRALSHFNGDWNMANSYCERKGVDHNFQIP